MILQRKPRKSHLQFSLIYSITGLRKNHTWNQRWNYCSSSTSNLSIIPIISAFLLVIATNIVCIVPDVIVQYQDRIIFNVFWKWRQRQCCHTWKLHQMWKIFFMVQSSFHAQKVWTIHGPVDDVCGGSCVDAQQISRTPPTVGNLLGDHHCWNFPMTRMSWSGNLS